MVTALSPAQLRELFTSVIKLNVENKINTHNSWQLQFIDHIDDMIGNALQNDCVEAGSSNFQAASCALDASVNIYSSRVDAIHSDARNVLAQLLRHESGSTRRVEEDYIIPRRRYGRIGANTIASNESLICMDTKQQLRRVHDSDYMLGECSSSAKNLMLNRLSVGNCGELILDGSKYHCGHLWFANESPEADCSVTAQREEESFGDFGGNADFFDPPEAAGDILDEQSSSNNDDDEIPRIVNSSFHRPLAKRSPTARYHITFDKKCIATVDAARPTMNKRISDGGAADDCAFIDFSTTACLSSHEFDQLFAQADTPGENKIANKTLKSWKQNRRLLPDEVHYDVDSLLRPFNLRSIALKRIDTDATDRGLYRPVYTTVDNFQEGGEDRTNHFLSAATTKRKKKEKHAWPIHEAEDFAWDGGAVTFGDDGRFSFDFNPMHSEVVEQQTVTAITLSNPRHSSSIIAELQSGMRLLPSPILVQSMILQSQTAAYSKNVDVKTLKERLFKSLNNFAEGKPDSILFSHAVSQCSAESGGNHTEQASIPYYFICTLQLCNDHGYELEGQLDLGDVTIRIKPPT